MNLKHRKTFNNMAKYTFEHQRSFIIQEQHSTEISISTYRNPFLVINSLLFFLNLKENNYLLQWLAMKKQDEASNITQEVESTGDHILVIAKDIIIFIIIKFLYFNFNPVLLIAYLYYLDEIY